MSPDATEANLGAAEGSGNDPGVSQHGTRPATTVTDATAASRDAQGSVPSNLFSHWQASEEGISGNQVTPADREWAEHMRLRQADLAQLYKQRAANVVEEQEEQERVIREVDDMVRALLEDVYEGGREFQDDDGVIRKFAQRQHGATLRSLRRSRATYGKYLRRQQEYVNNIWMTDLTDHKAGSEATTRARLQRAAEVMQTTLKDGLAREKALQAELDSVNREIAEASELIREGVDLSWEQKRDISRIMDAKHRAAAELEAETRNISRIRRRVAEVAKDKRDVELAITSGEMEIIDRTEKILAGAAQEQALLEARKKLEQDVKDARMTLKSLALENQGKSKRVDAAKHDVGAIEAQSKRLELDLVQLQKSREKRLELAKRNEATIQKTHYDVRNSVKQNADLIKLVEARERELDKLRASGRRIASDRAETMEKTENLRQQLHDMRLDLRTLRQGTAEMQAESHATLKQIRCNQEEMRSLEFKRSEMTREARLRISRFEQFQGAVKTLEVRKSGLEHDLARSKLRADESKARLRSQAEERDALLLQCRHLQAEQVNLWRSCEKKEREIFAMNKQALHTEWEIKRSRNRCEAIVQDRVTLAVQLRDRQAEISDMLRKYNDNLRLRRAAQKDAARKAAALQLAAAEKKTLDDDQEIISAEVQDLTHQTRLASQYLSVQVPEQARLEAAVARLKHERERQGRILVQTRLENDSMHDKFRSQDEELRAVYEKRILLEREIHLKHQAYAEDLSRIAVLKKKAANLSSERGLLRATNKARAARRIDAARISVMVSHAKAMVNSLEQERRRAVNMHRWTQSSSGVPGDAHSEPPELIRLVTRYQRELMALSRAEQAKRDLITQYESSYLNMRASKTSSLDPGAAPSPPSIPEMEEQYVQLHNLYKEKRAQYRHMDVQLKMYRAQCREHGHVIGTLDSRMSELKAEYMRNRSADESAPVVAA